MTGERPAVPFRAPAPCPPAAGKASCPHACGTPIGAPRLPGECSAVTRPPVGRLAGPPPATGQHLPCWHPNPSPGAPWPPRTGRRAELNPRLLQGWGLCAMCPVHTGWGGLPARTVPRPTPTPPTPPPASGPPARETRGPPASGWLFCSFCLLYCPRRGCRVDGLRPVRFPSERGEPRRFTATATPAHAAAMKRDPPDPMWTPALPEGGHLRPPAPAPATEPACPTPRSPQQRPDRRSGLGAQRETGGHRTAHCSGTRGAGRKRRGTGRAGGQCGLRSCTGLTRSPPNPRPPRTSERYMKLRPWPMALVRMRSYVTEGER